MRVSETTQQEFCVIGNGSLSCIVSKSLNNLNET